MIYRDCTRYSNEEARKQFQLNIVVVVFVLELNITRVQLESNSSPTRGGLNFDFSPLAIAQLAQQKMLVMCS